MARTYLYVPFEEYEQLKKRGAHWDTKLKAWYIDATQDSNVFKRWLGDTAEDKDEFLVESSNAYAVAGITECWNCGKPTKVVTIYCETGKVDNEPYRQFTVSNITAVDEALRKQLTPWPTFRLDENDELGTQGFINHCSNCDAPQGDLLLHCEPSGPFFSIREAEPGALTVTRLKGKIRLDGDEGFEP